MTRDELVTKIDSCEDKINELRQQVDSILAPVKAKTKDAMKYIRFFEKKDRKPGLNF